MIDPNVISGFLAAIAAALGTWLTARRVNASTARKNDKDGERDDFVVLRDTWLQERARMLSERDAQNDRYTALEARVTDVEDSLHAEQRDSEALVEALRTLLDWFNEQFPTHKPPALSPRVQQRLKENR